MRGLFHHWRLLALCAAVVAGCASPSPPDFDTRLDALLPADAILLGEQHDAAEHHVLERRMVEALAQRGQLAALAMEMADSGHSTAGLAREAGEDQVRTALAWNDAGWPWSAYGPVVMAAVRAGIPVVGANLASGAMRGAMADAALDNHLAPAALAQQRDRIRDGHCDLLPASQIAPMTRIQIARDAAMAHAIVAAVQPGKTVLLVAGGGHVSRPLGVPTHLPASLRYVVVLAVAGATEAGHAVESDTVWQTAAMPPVDHCAELRQQFQGKAAPAPLPSKAP